MNSTLDQTRAADCLRSERVAIGEKLAQLVSRWPKYATIYAADPAEFALLETHTLVDYIALLIETGDEVYRQLYLGEKVKQFFDPLIDQSERAEREAVLLTSEKNIFHTALGLFPECQKLVDEVFDAIRVTLTTQAKVELKVLFVGDCLILDVMSFLKASALEDGVGLLPNFITSHDATEIRSQASEFAKEPFDVVFYSPFTYSLLSNYSALQRLRVLSNPRKMMSDVRDAVTQAVMTFDALTDLFDCPIICHAPAPIMRGDGSAKDRLTAALTFPYRSAATRRLGKALRQKASKRNGEGRVVYILDEAEVVGSAGLEAAGRYIYRSYLQHPAAFGAMLAPYYRDILMVVGRIIKRKLIVCDLDNTLWDGVIGEGHGVKLLQERHAPLIALKQRGVVLAINSKNDPEKVKWESKNGYLSIDDFVSRQINWDPKYLNMRRIADHLNLKEKDFIFIDDRADERDMAEDQFPGLLSLDALASRSWRLLGLWAHLLPQKEGGDRTDFYKQRDMRQAFIFAEAELDENERAESFKKLDLKLIIREAGASDTNRVMDLINRTNQFNTTGSRVTKRDIIELQRRPDARVLIADALDRFGSMGTISVLIAERVPKGVSVSTFVLSCRVFGYGMEYAMLHRVREMISENEEIFGPLTNTEFNQPCRNIYKNAGFSQTDDGWRLTSLAAYKRIKTPWLIVKNDDYVLTTKV